jgi:hypothetical protein
MGMSLLATVVRPFLVIMLIALAGVMFELHAEPLLEADEALSD